jgi:F0F1-type ATP synthase delta subunit
MENLAKLNTITANWSYQKYMVFLLIYCAFADYDLDEREVETIEEMFEGENIKAMRKVYANTTESQRLAILEEFKHMFCQRAEEREKIFAQIDLVFYADNQFTRLERDVRNHLRQLLV